MIAIFSGSNFVDELSNLFRNGFKILFSFCGSCFSRITNTGVFCYLHPLSLSPSPALLNCAINEIFLQLHRLLLTKAKPNPAVNAGANLFPFRLRDHLCFQKFLLVDGLEPIASA